MRIVVFGAGAVGGYFGGRLKNRIAANRLYASMKLLLDTVKAFFQEMTPDQALAWAGVEL